MDVKNMCHKLIFFLKKEKFHFSHPFLLVFFQPSLLELSVNWALNMHLNANRTIVNRLKKYK